MPGDAASKEAAVDDGVNDAVPATHTAPRVPSPAEREAPSDRRSTPPSAARSGDDGRGLLGLRARLDKMSRPRSRSDDLDSDSSSTSSLPRGGPPAKRRPSTREWSPERSARAGDPTGAVGAPPSPPEDSFDFARLANSEAPPPPTGLNDAVPSTDPSASGTADGPPDAATTRSAAGPSSVARDLGVKHTPGRVVTIDEVISLVHPDDEGSILARRAASARTLATADVVCTRHVIVSGRSRRARPVVNLLGDPGAEDLISLQAALSVSLAAPAPTATPAAAGVNVNRDYAHWRWACESLPKPKEAGDWLLYCARCFCYVCNKRAGECDDWTLHAFATEGGCWEEMRRVARRRRNGHAPARAEAAEREARAVRDKVLEDVEMGAGVEETGGAVVGARLMVSAEDEPPGEGTGSDTEEH